MATQILGKVAYTSRGAYDSSFSYEINDVVTYNGSSYVSLKETKGNLPTNENYWMLLAQKGDTYEVTEDDLNIIANQITEDANSSFNQNVDTKTEAFNTNASNKTDEFDSNVTSKTETFNTNAEEKTTSFNENATSKVNAYDENATTKLNTYDENATTKLSEYNANADTRLQEFNDNADSYNERITANENDIAENTQRTRRIENNIFEAGEATGESINIQDSVLSELTGFRAKAVNTQKTTTGKNLLDYTDILANINGLTSTINEDGSITTKGILNGNYIAVVPFRDITDLLEDGETHTISQSVADTNLYIRVQYNDISTGAVNYIQCNTTNSKSFTVNKSKYVYKVAVQTNSATNWGTSELTKTYKYMLCKGTDTVANGFEPYTGGMASPNPSFPSQIPVIEAGEDVEFKSIGKNLLNLAVGTQLNGLKINVENGNEINVSGTPTQNWANITAITYENIEKGTYTFSMKESTQVCSVSLYTVFKSGVVKECQIPKGTLQKTVTFTEDVKSYRVYIFNMTAGTEIDTTLHLQLERGDTATEYEPYVESNLATSVPENEFVGATNTTADEFYTEYNEDDKKEHLYLAKNVGRRILTGTENWSIQQSGTANYFYQLYLGAKTLVNASCISSHYTTNFISTTNTNEGIYNTTEAFRVRYGTEKTLEEWKAQLAENNVTVLYGLVTPYVIDLGAIDQLKTWTDVTNILNNSSIPFNMTANYYRNFISTIRNLQINNGALQTELANMESRLSALETSVSNLQTSQANESEMTE